VSGVLKDFGHVTVLTGYIKRKAKRNAAEQTDLISLVSI